jgi:transposase
MDTLPDLQRLSATEKDALIGELWSCVVALTATVAELQGRLAKNSRNSSKPPSSDGLNKPKPKSLRQKGEKPTGGQKGHTGHTLTRVAQPDLIEKHAPVSPCDVCHRPLDEALDKAVVVETRQVFDLPPLRCEVTEHQVLEVPCSCGAVHRGTFPAAVSAPVQYGVRSKAAVVQLTHHHMLPLARTGELMGDLFGLPMSDATVLAIQAEAQVRLAPTVAAMGEALTAAAVAHADESGMRVAGKIHWMHVLVTPLLTWLGAHPKRGKEAFNAFGLLIAFAGTLIHDGWKPYRELACKHGLCNAHHLRELTYVFEQMGQAWAKCLFDLLLAACHEVAEVGAPLPAERIAYYRTTYDQILTTGAAANPRAPPSGKRGRTKQSKALNLIDRLRLYADDVWRFMIDPLVPFTNNLGEQAIRMPKVKQKVSGGFRTPGGLDTFCTIRSYLATMHKQGANLFNALALTFQGTPPQPRFA